MRPVTSFPPGINQQQILNLFATIGIGLNQDVEQQSDATRVGMQRAAKDGLQLLMPEISFTQTWEPPQIVRMDSDA